MFKIDEIYRRVDLHQVYGGQRQGGISTPRRHDIIMLFSSPTGEQYGYSDGWTEGRKYLYTGEGQMGDMTFTRGNRAIRDHEQNKRELHLFEYVRSGHVRYVGQMRCAGYREA